LDCLTKCIGAHLEKWNSKREAVFPLVKVKLLVSKATELQTFFYPPFLFSWYTYIFFALC
jgi:hypothetical protein